MGKRFFNRHKKICVILGGSIFFLCFFVYRTRIDFSEEGLLLKYEVSPAWDEGRGAWLLYNTVAYIYNNGMVEIVAEDFELGYEINFIPVTLSLDERDIKKLKYAIITSGFMSLDESIDDKLSCDGTLKYITVYSAKAIHRSGGLNPNDMRFLRVQEEIKSLIGGAISDFTEKMKNTLEKKYIK